MSETKQQSNITKKFDFNDPLIRNKAQHLASIWNKRSRAWEKYDKATQIVKENRKKLAELNKWLQLAKKFETQGTPEQKSNLANQNLQSEIKDMKEYAKKTEILIKQFSYALLNKENIPTKPLLPECFNYDEDNCSKEVLCNWKNNNCNYVNFIGVSENGDDDDDMRSENKTISAKYGFIPGEMKNGRFLITPNNIDDFLPEDKILVKQYRDWKLYKKRKNKLIQENEPLEQENKSPETVALEKEMKASLPVDLEHPQFSKGANLGDPDEYFPLEDHNISTNRGKIGGKRKTKRKRRKRKTMKNKRRKRKKTMKKRKSRKRRKTKKRSKRR